LLPEAAAAAVSAARSHSGYPPYGARHPAPTPTVAAPALTDALAGIPEEQTVELFLHRRTSFGIVFPPIFHSQFTLLFATFISLSSSGASFSSPFPTHVSD
jgi:hypothetical protein